MDTCWALSYLSDGPNERIEEVVEYGITRKVVDLLSHKSHKVQTSALRVVGNIVTGTEQQTQTVLNAGVLRKLKDLLSSDKKSIRKEASWTLSNIGAGNTKQIQAIINEGIIPKLIELMRDEEPQEIRREAAWTISNATNGGTPQQIKYMVTRGAIESFCGLLDSTDIKSLIVGLEGIENFVKAGETDDYENPYSKRVEACRGIDFIEELQQHKEYDVQKRAMYIVEKYFEGDSDGDIEQDFNFSFPSFSNDDNKFTDWKF
jgi:HEAT repeat protein